MLNSSSQENNFESLFNVLGPFDLFSTSSSSSSSTISTKSNDPMSRSRRELVVKICLLVDNPSDLHVSVAAMEALSALADSSQYSPTSNSSSSPNYSNGGEPHKLFSLIENSGALTSVMETFLCRLEREEVEKGTKPSPDDIESFGLANVIRLQIIDFLTKNISKGYYTLAHYLLGLPGPFEGRFSSDLQIETPKKGPSNCLHMVIELLSFGLGNPSSPLVCLDHPMLAARLYELVQRIIEVPYLQKGILSFLRKMEPSSFILSQIHNLSPELFDEEDSQFTEYQLLQKSSIYRCTSLDLYDSILYGNVKYSISLLEKLLLSLPKDLQILYLLKRYNDAQTETFRSSFQSLEYSLLKILELIFSLPLPIYDQDRFKEIIRSLYLTITPCLVKIFLRMDLSYDGGREYSSISCISNFLLPLGNYYISNKESFDGEEGKSLFLISLEWILITNANKSDLITRTLCYSLLTSALQNGINLKENIMDSCVGGNIFFDNLVGDLLLPLETGLAPWKSVCCVFLFTIAKEIPSIIDRLFSIGLVRNLILSLRGDDRFIDREEEEEDRVNDGDADGCLYLWKAKISLFQQISQGKNSLFDCGLLDVLSSLSIVSDNGICSDLERKEMIWTPLMMLISVMSFGISSSSSSIIEGPIAMEDDDKTISKLNEGICSLLKKWNILEKVEYFPIKYLISTLVNCISSYGINDPFRGSCRRMVLNILMGNDQKKNLSLCISFWLKEIKFYPKEEDTNVNGENNSIWNTKKDHSYDLQFPLLPIKLLIDILEEKGCEGSEDIMDLIYEVINHFGLKDDFEIERISQILNNFSSSSSAAVAAAAAASHPLFLMLKKI